MRRVSAAVLGVAVFLVSAASASGGHGVEELLFDHPEVAAGPTAPGGPEVNSDPVGAWHRIATIATGNPHTDLDFFTQGGEIYAAVGTLAVGANGGGQTIVRLTQGGQVVENPLNPGKPEFVSAHGSAACFSEPTQALGLQHDVEATPKGDAILNTSWPFSVRKDAQLLIDATDNPGRCHDQGPMAGLVGAPQGGLEIIDITDIENPVEIGLISHIGEAHTVNVDPKRPWIAYAVTSDAVGVDQLPDGSFKRRNEVHGGDQNDLDGFEVVDLSSCMNFPIGTDLLEKRARCRPKVYRYRYPTAEMALGHTLQTGPNAIFGCHELEVYPNDRLTCGSGNAAMYFDMSGAFDGNGKPRGTPLPCTVRDSTSTAPFRTGAKITDCVAIGGPDLSVPGWLAMNPRPSLEGVRWLGSAHHMGRGAGGTVTTFDASEDIDFDHELELSGSRRFLIATDERGGGVSPPGAACTTSDTFPTDNKQGNGGLHFYRVDRLDTTLPASAEEAWEAYALTPSGEKAIYRAPIFTQPQGTLCTAHVFHQIPGQNRIFMGWYSQGTQVIDFIEHRNGTVSFVQTGRFIPSNANEWVSAVFKMKRNSNGSYTYWGATGDFNLGAAGRSAIDIYKVTLPAPPRPFGQGGDDGDDGDCPSNDDLDADGLIDARESLLGTLLANRDSDLDGIKDGDDDANGNGEDDEDEDDDDDCPDRDSDGDGEDDEDEDDDD